MSRASKDDQQNTTEFRMVRYSKNSNIDPRDEELRKLRAEMDEYSRKVIQLEIKQKHLDKTSIIHSNQEEAAGQIIPKLIQYNTVMMMILAQMQTGKTGVMAELINQWIEANPDISPKNIIILSGLSSLEWKEQTQNRMPPTIYNQIFHRNDLDEFSKMMKQRQCSDNMNMLILIDEIQIASQKNQSLHKLFDELNLYDKLGLMTNRIKLVEFSATPNGTLYDLMKWKDNAHKYIMDPGHNYTGCKKLLEQNRIFQFRNLYNNKTRRAPIAPINEIKQKIEEHFEEPMYHIIRTPTGQASDTIKDMFKHVFGSSVQIIHYDCSIDTTVKSMDKKMNKKPRKHTFIFIKEMWRCSKTLNKKHLGIYYERYTPQPDDSIIIQGLGRGCGYDDNGKSIFFTNIGSVEKYITLLTSNFEADVDWRSNTTTLSRSGIESSGTYMNPTLYTKRYMTQKFQNYQSFKRYFEKNVQAKVPRKKTEGPNGFIEQSVQGKKKEVLSIGKVKKLKTHKMGKQSYKVYYCYADVNDPSTLYYYLVHY